METLPTNRFVQNHAVGSVLGRKGAALCIDAKHDKRLVARIADGAPPCWSHPHNRAFTNREDLAVDLEFALARERKK